jgi:hypothetical protein
MIEPWHDFWHQKMRESLLATVGIIELKDINIFERVLKCLFLTHAEQKQKILKRQISFLELDIINLTWEIS